MGTITTDANETFRDYTVSGSPSSGVHEPVKADIRAWGATIDVTLTSAITGTVIGTAVTYATQSELYADLAHVAGVLGVVYDDTTAAYNGIYVKSGASGAGAWTITDLTLPSTFVADLATVLAQIGEVAGARDTAVSASATSTAQAAISTSQAVIATAQAVIATAQAVIATAAAEASGDVTFFDTKAAAVAALGGLAEGAIVEVFVDETQADARTRYKVVSAALVLKANLSSSANITYAPEGTGSAVRTVQSWAREEMITPRDFSAAYDGTTDDTANIQAGLDYLASLPRGGAMKLPRGAIKHGPLTVSNRVQIYHEGCETVPLLNTTTTQKLYNVTGDNVRVSGLLIEGYAATLSTGIAKYIIFGDNCDGLLVEDIDLKDITASDGLSGLSNLAVTHGVYVQNAYNPRVRRMRVENLSGAAAFAKATNGFDLHDSYILDTRWYSVEISNDNVAYQVRNSRIRSTSVNSVLFGGFVNVMSQTSGAASTTSLAIGTGSKVFTVASSAYTGFTVGRGVTAKSATGTNYMLGTVTSYSGTTLTLNITDTVGSGTYADWTISSTNLPDKWGSLHNLDISGPCNYGAAIRLLSASKLNVTDCHVHDVTSGALHLVGEPVAYVALDRRGTVVGAAESGPCEDVIFSNNIFEAGPGALGHIAYAINNQFKSIRDPHKNIQITGGAVRSLNADYRFRNILTANGQQAGIDGLSVRGLVGTSLTDTTAGRITGAMSFAATAVSGALSAISVNGCKIEDIGTPSASSHTGIYAQAEINDIDLSNNRIKNFFYGIRTASLLWSVKGLHDNQFIGCTTDLVPNTPNTEILSWGTAVPTLGIYKKGHLHYQSSTTSAASNGWRCSVAGGANSITYSAGLSGASVAANKQIRNTAGVVYVIITAGGGVTANEPVHTTVGQEVTGADGYTYRCLSATTARWIPFAADGATVALP